MKTMYLLLVSGVLMPTGISFAQETGTTDIIVSGNEYVEVFKPSSEKGECAAIDVSGTILDTESRTVLFSKTFISTPTAHSYVVWAGMPGGIHTVYTATFYMHSCAISELKTAQTYYAGEDRYASANAAYNSLLKESLP